MTLHPKAFERARREMDAVVGTERLPSFADRPNLPFVDAILKETIRWRNVAPTGVVHSVDAEDTYAGYKIPKGSILLANIWKMTHDPSNYHDPESFKPERFLSEGGNAPERDPRTLVFGFGRRICPGKDLADQTLFIAIAVAIAVLDISKLRVDGAESEPDVTYCGGLISHPSEFQCSVLPRSRKAASLIAAVIEEHPFGSGDADELNGLVWQ